MPDIPPHRDGYASSSALSATDKLRCLLSPGQITQHHMTISCDPHIDILLDRGNSGFAPQKGYKDGFPSFGGDDQHSLCPHCSCGPCVIKMPPDFLVGPQPPTSVIVISNTNCIASFGASLER